VLLTFGGRAYSPDVCGLSVAKDLPCHRDLLSADLLCYPSNGIALRSQLRLVEGDVVREVKRAVRRTVLQRLDQRLVLISLLLCIPPNTIRNIYVRAWTRHRERLVHALTAVALGHLLDQAIDGLDGEGDSDAFELERGHAEA
jgi:hypothetical protein